MIGCDSNNPKLVLTADGRSDPIYLPDADRDSPRRVIDTLLALDPDQSMSILEITLNNDFDSNTFSIKQNGALVGQIELKWTGTQAALTLCGARYDAWWKGILSPKYYLDSDCKCLASAKRPTFLHRRFVVQTGTNTYVLAVRNLLGLEFVLTESDAEIGCITRHGSRRMKAEFPDDLSLEIQAFLIWLAMSAAINIE